MPLGTFGPKHKKIKPTQRPNPIAQEFKPAGRRFERKVDADGKITHSIDQAHAALSQSKLKTLPPHPLIREQRRLKALQAIETAKALAEASQTSASELASETAPPVPDKANEAQKRAQEQTDEDAKLRANLALDAKIKADKIAAAQKAAEKKEEKK